jgi:hypothetical protein
LQTEKILKDKITSFETASRVFFEQFAEAFGKSDKKTFKDNLLPFFGSQDTCVDFVNLEAYPKYEDRTPDKWNEALKSVCEDPEVQFKALSQKDEGSLVLPDQILVEMLKPKPGGQMVEIRGNNNNLVLC